MLDKSNNMVDKGFNVLFGDYDMLDKRFKMLLVGKIFLIGVLVLGVVGCGRKDAGSKAEPVTAGSGMMGVDALPFQDAESGRWGMVDLDGNLLVGAQMEGKPTIAVGGRYWVEDEDGVLTLHGLDGERVGEDSYTAASEFYGGRAFVTPVDGEMMVVDSMGDKMASLGKIDGKMPELISDISEGVGVYKVGKYSGAVDVNGKSVLPAEYASVGACHDGKIVACVDKKFAFSEYTYDAETPFDSIYNVPDATAKIFDSTGNELLSISSGDYQIVYDRVFGSYLPVAQKLASRYGWGLIDVDGKEVLKADERVCTFFDMRGDRFIYGDSLMMCGVMDVTGQVIVKPEYDFIQFVSDSLLLAQKPSTDTSEGGLQLIDLQGRVLMGDAVSVSMYFPRAYNRAVAEQGEGLWSFIDASGKRVGPVLKASEVNYSYYGSETIPSAAYIKAMSGDDMQLKSK